MSTLIVTDRYGREIEPGAIPTPRLASVGGGMAYFVPTVYGQRGVPGVWYLHDHGYEAPDGKYQHVRVVEKADKYPGDDR